MNRQERRANKKGFKKDIELIALNSMGEIIFKGTGKGTERRYSEELFLILQQLHGCCNYFGSLLGFALCKRIVEKHKGIIFSDAKKNGDGFFNIILPVERVL